MSEKDNKKTNANKLTDIKKMINPKTRGTVEFPDDIDVPNFERTTQQPAFVPAHEEVKPEPIKKNPYFEPNKSAKLSEDVITKVKMLTPFIHKRHGYDLRATNSFIDIVLDFYAENALDENEKEDFKKIYEVMTAPKRDSK